MQASGIEPRTFRLPSERANLCSKHAGSPIEKNPGPGAIFIKILTSLSALTVLVSRLNLSSWRDLSNQTDNILIFKVSSSYPEYFNKKFEVLTEISMSILECKCTQTCKIFDNYGPWISKSACSPT